MFVVARQTELALYVMKTLCHMQVKGYDTDNDLCYNMCWTCPLLSNDLALSVTNPHGATYSTTITHLRVYKVY
jgi:hypothetical protein